MPSDPMAKVSGDNSMAEKRGVGEHARPAALQDLRDMAKAGLLEPQTSEMGLTSLVMACQDEADRIRIGRLVFRRLKPSSVERRPARPFKGSSEGPKSCSDVQFDETRDRLLFGRQGALESWMTLKGSCPVWGGLRLASALSSVAWDGGRGKA
jgi:hypothetical protein